MRKGQAECLRDYRLIAPEVSQETCPPDPTLDGNEDDPANAGRGALAVNGRMVEPLHAEMARRTIALADAIAARQAAS